MKDNYSWLDDELDKLEFNRTQHSNGIVVTGYARLENKVEFKQTIISQIEKIETQSYENGESSGYADWQAILSEEFDIEADTPFKASSELAKQIVIEKLRARIEAVKLLFWKYKELNDQSVDMEFAEAYGIIKEELEADLTEKLKELEGKV